MYYYFYDLNEVLIDRYPARIASKIRELDSSSNFVFLFSEKYKNDVPVNLPEKSKSFFIPSLSKKKMSQLITDFKPISLTTIAQRIPDMWVLTFFNHKGIPTNIVQHGLWSDKLQRVSLIILIINKFSKFFNYVSYTWEICKLNNIPFYSTLLDLHGFLLKENKTIPETKYLNSDLIRAQKVFTFDTTWNDYYVKKYGYKLEDLIYIGNPDYLILKTLNLNKIENSICYLCQSLVEDGRLSKDKYLQFLKMLLKSIPVEKKLYVKLHPRSKKVLYSILLDNPNVVFTNDLPVCSHYIAHYTGLLATVYQITNNILIWIFDNHHTPEYFKKFGSVITSNENELIEFINKDVTNCNKNFNKKSLIDNFKNYDPIKVIANNLMK